ncbi:MAG: GGDEF domain-containing protein [Clostridia bacterium]|nr:GGDEF domain-containing protein [Clostridia bacterium]
MISSRLCIVSLMLLLTSQVVSAEVHTTNTVTANAVWSGNMTVYGLCCIVFAMITAFVLLDLRKTKRKMQYNRMIDEETGIGNLVHFTHQFNMISDLSCGMYYIAYIIIDSNYLQIYHGESTFTDSVKYTAGVLSSYANHNEIAARITENGFAFAFRSVNADAAKQQAEEIIDKLTLYIEAEEKSFKPVFHAALYNLNAADRSCELLLFNLRKNCSKLIGTDRQLVLCDANMMNSAAREKQLLESIENGFKNREFKLYLQFIVDNKTKKIVSAEALSRWDSADKGLLSPAKYIETMESNGMITVLDYYMFEMTCRQLHKWKDTEFDNLTISCNFTRITLSEDDFAEKIKDISNKYVFDKSKLVIEITEDAIEKNRENAMENVRECKKMGFRIALDDLGSGYTSLINLCEYPIDIVKIDRDILLKTDRQNGRDLFVGMIALAHSLNLKVVCEGVETEEQKTLVSATECDLIQGWYYSKAFPAREGEAFVRQYSEKLIG